MSSLRALIVMSQLKTLRQVKDSHSYGMTIFYFNKNKIERVYAPVFFRFNSYFNLLKSYNAMKGNFDKSG